MITWLIGMSGAGKTTIARALHSLLRAEGEPVLLLDGDVLRELWGDNPPHTVAGREINAGRISRFCKLLDDQGISAVVAVLSIFPQWQAWNRRELRDYFEVFLDVPMDDLVARDTKGLYAAALAGTMSDVVGVDIPFVRPPCPDLVLDSSGRTGTPEELATSVLDALRRRGR